MKRNEIIATLYRKPSTLDEYEKLKLCFELEDGAPSINDIDKWFAGVIAGLYYRPNKTVLVLVNEYHLEMREFFRDLFYCEDCACWPDIDIYEDFIYNHLFCDLYFTSKYLNIPMKENFKIIDCEFGMVEAEKRLASYCSTIDEWRFPQRNNYVVLPVKNIDWVSFRSIDKLQLWIEIFNKFKPEGK